MKHRCYFKLTETYYLLQKIQHVDGHQANIEGSARRVLKVDDVMVARSYI